MSTKDVKNVNIVVFDHFVFTRNPVESRVLVQDTTQYNLFQNILILNTVKNALKIILPCLYCQYLSQNIKKVIVELLKLKLTLYTQKPLLHSLHYLVLMFHSNVHCIVKNLILGTIQYRIIVF